MTLSRNSRSVNTDRNDPVEYRIENYGTIVQGQLVSNEMNELLDSSLQSLKHAKLTDNCLEARKPANKGKNRFRNVIPCKCIGCLSHM